MVTAFARVMTLAHSFAEKRVAPGPWVESAACKGRTDMFNESLQEQAVAVMVCNSCEVKRDCLMYAVKNGEMFGVWGATTESQRRRLIKDSFTSDVKVLLEKHWVENAKSLERVKRRAEAKAEEDARAARRYRRARQKYEAAKAKTNTD